MLIQTVTLPETSFFISGLLQFMAASYALRLNRLFGAARVGWSLFSAFILLALLHVVQCVMPSGNSTIPALGSEISLIYALISMLLLIGMMHLEAVLKERIKLEQREREIRSELENEVKKKTGYLTRAIEELQTEIDARTEMEATMETRTLELRAVSRQAEMAELAADVLRRVGEMIKSVNISVDLVSDQVKQSKIANVVRVGEMIRQQQADLGKFMTDDPRGQKLPIYIAQLAEHLGEEQAELLNELKSLKTHLENVLTAQREFDRLAGVGLLPNVARLIQETLNHQDELLVGNIVTDATGQTWS